MSDTIYEVTGLTCNGCVNRVQQTLAAYAETATVTLSPPQAVLTHASAEISTLNQALASIGHYQLIAPPQPDATTPNQAPAKSWFATYYPLLLIIGFIIMVTTLVQLGSPFDGTLWMRHFMAGFFIVFAFFKLLDIRSFADSYAMYDLLAMRVKAYGLLYPFIELVLGIAYLTNWQPTFTNSVTLLVMLFSSIGVIKSVMDKQKIRCACLGSVFNLPMSTVTIIEDLSMALMALWMLVG